MTRCRRNKKGDRGAARNRRHSSALVENWQNLNLDPSAPAHRAHVAWLQCLTSGHRSHAAAEQSRLAQGRKNPLPPSGKIIQGCLPCLGGLCPQKHTLKVKNTGGGNLTQSSCVPCSVCCGFAAENWCLTIFYYFSMSFFCQIFLGSVSWKKFWVELDSTNPTIYILSKP